MSEEKKEELSRAKKDQILREAVSYYLRNDFRVPEIREVCEKFIANVDKAVLTSEHADAHHSEHENKPKSK